MYHVYFEFTFNNRIVIKIERINHCMKISVVLNVCWVFVLSIFKYLSCALRIHVNITLNIIEKISGELVYVF